MGVIQMSNNHQKLQLTDSQVTAFLHLIDVSLTGQKLSDLQQITSKFMETVPFSKSYHAHWPQTPTNVG